MAVDFDDTLVGWRDYPEGEWIPGARDVLKAWRRRGYTVIVHSARCQFPQGREQIEATLRDAGFKLGPKLKIEPKVLADFYVDDRAVSFDGDWSATRKLIRE